MKLFVFPTPCPNVGHWGRCAASFEDWKADGCERREIGRDQEDRVGVLHQFGPRSAGGEGRSDLIPAGYAHQVPARDVRNRPLQHFAASSD